MGRKDGNQKDPQTVDEDKEEDESDDDNGESSEEEDSEETDDEDDEDKLLDDPSVNECIAVGNFNAQQEGDLTFKVNMSLQKFIAMLLLQSILY